MKPDPQNHMAAALLSLGIVLIVFMAIFYLVSTYAM